MSDPCTVVGCSKPTKARGWCATHYQRWRAHGSVDVVKPPGRKPRGRTLHVACGACGRPVAIVATTRGVWGALADHRRECEAA